MKSIASYIPTTQRYGKTKQNKSNKKEYQKNQNIDNL